MTISDAERVEVEAISALDSVAFDMGESSLADIADTAWELDQGLVDSGTIEVHAVAESDGRKAHVDTSAHSCGRVEGGDRIALVARRPCRTDVVHCVAE